MHQSGIFAENGRVEAQPIGDYDPIPPHLLDNIFQPRLTPVASDLKLAQAMKEKFYSPNIATERESWAQAELARFLRRTGNMAALGDAWMSGLFPEGEVCSVLRESGDHSVFFSLAVTRYGVVGWSAQRVGTKYVRVRPDAEELQFEFLFDLGKAHVLPTVASSPFRAFLSKTVPSQSLGCMVELQGEPVALLKWQSDRGFIGVREETLRALADQLEVPQDMTTGTTPEEDSDAQLSLMVSLMRHMDPALDENACLSTAMRSLCNDPTTEASLDSSTLDLENFDDEVLEDVLDKADRVELRKAKKIEDAFKEGVKKKQAVLRAICKQSFQAKPAGKRRQPAKKSTAVSAQEMDRWWVTTKGDDRFIVRYLPDSARHYTDNVNGRFLLFQDSIGFTRKSFSWTQRGNQAASLMLLRTAWERHISAYGGECPLPAVLFANSEW